MIMKEDESESVSRALPAMSMIDLILMMQEGDIDMKVVDENGSERK